MSRRLPFRPALALAAAAVLSAGCGSSASTSSPSSAASASSTSTSSTSSASSPASTSSTGSTASPSASASASAVSGSITVFAAASLTKAFSAVGKKFEAAHPGASVRFSFGASSTLAQQIIAGAPADVFASASPRNMTQVTKAGAAANARTFATNTAEVAVAPGAASRVSSIADLAKAGVKVALCQPQVPCGALAQTVLSKARVTVKPVTQGLDVKSTLAYVSGGEADAAIVYVTDVKAAGAKVKGVEIPAADNASTAYPIATLKASKNPALADAFEQLVLSADGQQVLHDAGFAAP